MAVSAESLALWKKVKENFARLRGCEGPHEWVPDPEDTYHKEDHFKDRRCKKCGGTMDVLRAAVYSDGVTHGRAAERGGR